jgi:hypothetical protein
MGLFNFWSWPAELIDDLRQWMVVRSALKEPSTQSELKAFQDLEIRQDKIGRLYTVVNLPEELWPYEKRNMAWPYVLEKLRTVDELLMKVRLNELLFPDVKPIDDAYAYLIVLSPSIESLSIWKLLRWLLNMTVTITTLFLTDRIILKITGSGIIDHILSLF